MGISVGDLQVSGRSPHELIHPFSDYCPLIFRVDLVVHSLKDLPTSLPPGFTIGAVCK